MMIKYRVYPTKNFICGILYQEAAMLGPKHTGLHIEVGQIKALFDQHGLKK